jgi:hypothetical protein
VSGMPDIWWFLFRTLLTSIILIMGVQVFCSLLFFVLTMSIHR